MNALGNSRWVGTASFCASALSFFAAAVLGTLGCNPHDDDGGAGRIRAIVNADGGSGGSGGSGGTGGSPSSSSSSASGGETGEIPPEACRFEEEIAFNLPSGFLTDQLDDVAADTSGLCVEGELSYALRDMDGDLLADLVIADRCDLAGVGTDAWEIYLNDGQRFADAPLVWSLPTGFGTDELDDLSDDSSATCTEGELSFELLDMDGDLRPDLVVTDNCDIAGVGTTHWQVFLNLGDRFAPVALDWALPSGFPTDDLDDVQSEDGLCAEGARRIATRDMNGDLRPDLVVTDNCDHAGVGTTHWLVYENVGDGFEPVATQWTLPTGYYTDDLDQIADDSTSTCDFGQLSFGLRDMDGDRAPDLVVTDACDPDEVGATHWRVYLGQGDRFAEIAIPWTLHSTLAWDEFDDLAGDDSGLCTESELSFGVMDVDGDNASDLLVTDRCDFNHVGSTHWVLYRANLTRFEEAASWTLPPGFGGDHLDDLQQDDGGNCIEGELSTQVMDVNGDRVLDLVVADDCDLAGVGTTHWRVFAGVCDAP